jgi:hypothetical protein
MKTNLLENETSTQSTEDIQASIEKSINKLETVINDRQNESFKQLLDMTGVQPGQSIPVVSNGKTTEIKTFEATVMPLGFSVTPVPNVENLFNVKLMAQYKLPEQTTFVDGEVLIREGISVTSSYILRTRNPESNKITDLPSETLCKIIYKENVGRYSTPVKEIISIVPIEIETAAVASVEEILEQEA